LNRWKLTSSNPLYFGSVENLEDISKAEVIYFEQKKKDLQTERRFNLWIFFAQKYLPKLIFNNSILLICVSVYEVIAIFAGVKRLSLAVCGVGEGVRVWGTCRLHWVDGDTLELYRFFSPWKWKLINVLVKSELVNVN